MSHWIQKRQCTKQQQRFVITSTVTTVGDSGVSGPIPTDWNGWTIDAKVSALPTVPEETKKTSAVGALRKVRTASTDFAVYWSSP